MSAIPWKYAAENALNSLGESRSGLSDLRDHLASDWPEGHGPRDPEARREAIRLSAAAKALLDEAKDALDRSVGGPRMSPPANLPTFT